MAHKKAGGSSRNGRDSVGTEAWREDVRWPGCEGRGHHRQAARHEDAAGTNVGLGRDHTLFALIDGHVTYESEGEKKRVSVYPVE